METPNKKIINETVNMEADAAAAKPESVNVEDVRTLVINLLDTVQALTMAIKQLSINQNTIEHYIAKEVQKIPKAEYDVKMGELRKTVLAELMEQVKNNKDLAAAVKADLNAAESKSELPVKEQPSKVKKSIFDEHSA